MVETVRPIPGPAVETPRTAGTTVVGHKIADDCCVDVGVEVKLSERLRFQIARPGNHMKPGEYYMLEMVNGQPVLATLIPGGSILLLGQYEDERVPISVWADHGDGLKIYGITAVETATVTLEIYGIESEEEADLAQGISDAFEHMHEQAVSGIA